MASEPGEATEHTRSVNARAAAELPFDDTGDLEDARRGFVAGLPSLVVRDLEDRVVWEMDAYTRFQGVERDPPDTVHPSLWRQAGLNALHGLFEVAGGLYQIRGYDLSNMTLVEGETGVIVIDPLISVECARAALELYFEHRGERPVTGVIYTHSHVDHFGGVEGAVSPDDVRAGRVPVLAPEGFLEHAVSENVLAGVAMGRRAEYMYGAALPKGPRGQVDAGLGKTNSTGRVSLILPTRSVARTGEEAVIDGVRLVFQVTPGTEAPAEMNFHFPDTRVLCVAENATHNLHNILTLRGALVRDAHAWSRYLNETIELFGDRTDVLFAQHHWPTWGRERIVDYLEKQRDLYRYLHDQTLRLLNHGYTGAEIAERLELPPSLARAWHCRGYYGSVSHNVKAIYQRYMGWFDGNPAHLHALPPEEAGRRYVEFMGGADAVLAQARTAHERGEYRWVAQVVGHVVFAEPDNRAARELQADALEQLGYQAENATWRNFYLVGARELREGVAGQGEGGGSALASALTLEQVFDYLGVQLNGPRAGDRRIVLNWELGDTGERYALTLRHGALSAVRDKHAPEADATLALTRSALDRILRGATTVADAIQSGEVAIAGDSGKVAELFSLMDTFAPGFDIVTP